jgi:hypothetical protein
MSLLPTSYKILSNIIFSHLTPHVEELLENFSAIQVCVFWVLTPCTATVGYEGFGGPYCLHIQGQETSNLASWLWIPTKDQILIKYSAFFRYWRKKTVAQWDRAWVIYRLQEILRLTHERILYNILTEFGTPIKPVKIMKMCLNETNIKSA